MTAPIYYFNRYSGRIECEEVYGERSLRWVYGNPLGALALHGVVKRGVFSRFYGWRMDRPASRKAIRPFVEKYRVDTTEFAEPIGSFRTFNEFFYRRLKPGARRIDPDLGTAVFPADGRHLVAVDSEHWPGILVKGGRLDLDDLVRDPGMAERFRRGTLILSRLCPVDYHRFHFPVSGRVGAPRPISGPLFSVNPIALRRNLDIFIRNKRYVSKIDTEQWGSVLMVEVGATCVGAVEYTYTGGTQVTKGDEKGYFRFGGSSVITIFEPGRIAPAEDLLAHSSEFREVYARMGDTMGRVA